MKKLFLAGFAITLVLTGCSLNLSKPKQTVLKPEEAQQKAEDYINANLVQGGGATVDLPTVDNGLYKLAVTLPNKRTVDSYMTMDGTKFFPNVLEIKDEDQDVAEGDQQATGDNQQETKQTPLTKTDKPKVELFVMSYCPYGTQMEKAILPAVDALGKKIDFQIKFVSYSMHGAKESNENLTQYCLKTQQAAKFTPYLKCFLQAGDQAGCLKNTGVDQAKVKSCVAATDSKYKVTEQSKNTAAGGYPPFDIDKADNQKYGVQGSPTLVINGQQAEANRNPATLLKTICSAFTKAPAECQKQLSSETPAPGFGSGSDTSGGANSAAGCATPQQ